MEASRSSRDSSSDSDDAQTYVAPPDDAADAPNAMTVAAYAAATAVAAGAPEPALESALLAMDLESLRAAVRQRDRALGEVRHFGVL